MTYTTASSPVPTKDRDDSQNQDTTSEFEKLTYSYMRGEIDVKSYRSGLRRLNARLDLRKVAHKIFRKSNPR